MNTVGMSMAGWFRESRRRVTTPPNSVVWMTNRERSDVASLLWGERAEAKDLRMIRGYPVISIDEPPKASR